jgi:chromosome partitioning protein
MQMSTIICIANNKGGVGKSSLTVNLGGALAELGLKTLLVDLDPQSNLTSLFLNTSQTTAQTVADLVFDDVDAKNVIHVTKVPGLCIIPADAKLLDIDSRLAGDDDAQFILSEELELIRSQFHYILIDCPPNLGKATRMALVASDFVIVPIQCQDWAVKGCQQIKSHIERVRRRVNPRLNLMGIVINRFNSRRKMENIYYRILNKKFDGHMFQTVVQDNVPYVESVTAKKPITAYRPKSPQAEVLRKFAQEVIDRAKG